MTTEFPEEIFVLFNEDCKSIIAASIDEIKEFKKYISADLVESKNREIAELKEKLAYWQSRLSALELKQKGAEVKLR